MFSRAPTYFSLVELLVCIIILLDENHGLAYKILSFSYTTVFSCLVELLGNKKFQGHKYRKENKTATQNLERMW